MIQVGHLRLIDRGISRCANAFPVSVKPVRVLLLLALITEVVVGITNASSTKADLNPLCAAVGGRGTGDRSGVSSSCCLAGNEGRKQAQNEYYRGKSQRHSHQVGGRSDLHKVGGRLDAQSHILKSKVAGQTCPY